MNRFNVKRIAILTGLALFPAAAFAAGGEMSGLCEAFCAVIGCCACG